MFFTILMMTLKPGVTALGETSSTESSAEYLYNVMNQLQEYNRPSPLSVDRTTGPGGDFNRYNDNKKQEFSTDNSVNIESDQQFAEYVTPRYQIQAPKIEQKQVQAIKEPPLPLGLTRAELAFLYKSSLQQGSPVSLSLLKNSLAIGKTGQVIGNQLRQNSGNPGYYYYFYPLKTFASELQDNHGYKTINENRIRPQHSDLTAESSEKQMANPLFMAISGFIGMALIFMASVLFLPRFDNIGARNSSGEFLQLTKVAWEAIEGRNCSERFACELNKVAVKFKLSKRSRRLLENVVPINVGKQMLRMRKSARKRQECRTITCKCG